MAAAAAKLSNSLPVLHQQIAQQGRQLVEARADAREQKERANAVVAEASRQQRFFARYTLPTIGIYGGVGFGVGAGLAWLGYGYLKDWFGANSYIPAIATLGIGVTLFYFTPSLVRVSGKALDKTAPVAVGLYGASLGMAGYALYEGYRVYSAPAAP